MIDWKTVDALLGVVSIAVTSLMALYLFLTRRSRANAVEIQTLKGENMQLTQRLDMIESNVANLPTRNDFHKVELELEAVRGAVTGMGATLKAVQHTADNLNEYLLNKKGDRA